MEEQQKFEVAQEPQEPKKKGSKKGIVIALIVVIIAAALGAGYYFLFKNDSTKLQITAKDKVANSVDKIGAKAGDVFEDFENIGKRKINENLSKKPFTDKYTITGKINEISISDVSESDVTMAKSMINGQNIVIDTKGNLADNKFFAELSMTGEKIGNLVFNNEAIGVQVPSVESKYYTLFKSSLAESEDYAMFATMFDMVSNVLNSAEEGKYEFTDDEIKHFEKTYKGIIKDNIKDDRIKSESVEITVDGKNEKCDKVTYSIDAATAKSILTAYVEAFEKDTEGQDIILNKVTAIIEDTKILELYGAEMGMTMTADQLKTTAKEALPQLISELKAEVEALSTEGEGTIDIIVYATATKTHRVEVVVPDAGKATIDLEENGIKMSLTVENQEVMTIDIENKDNKFTATANMMNQMVLDITNEKSDNGNNMVAKLSFNDGYDNITAQLGIKNTIKEDSDKKLDEDIEISLVMEADGEKIDVALNINRLAEIVDSVDIPELNTTNSIDIVKEGYLDEMLGTSSYDDYDYDYEDMYNTIDTTTNTTNTTVNSTETEDIDYNDIYEQVEEIQNMQNSINVEDMNYDDVQQQVEEIQNLQDSINMNSLGL